MNTKCDGNLWKDATPISKHERLQQCGVVLGGIGTGGFEIWDDGAFHLWKIFNNGPSGLRKFRTSVRSIMPPSGLFFAIRTQDNGKVGLYKLQMPDYQRGEWLQETYQVPELRFPQSITSYGRQPFARLSYELDNSPLSVELEAFTPFIVHDLDASAWPVACFKVVLKNNCPRAISVAVIGSLQNCIQGYEEVLARPHNIFEANQYLGLHFPAPAGCDAPDAGSMCLGVSGPRQQLSYCRKWTAVRSNSATFWDQFSDKNALDDDESDISRFMRIAEELSELRTSGWDGNIDSLSEESKEHFASRLRRTVDGHRIEKHMPMYDEPGDIPATPTDIFQGDPSDSPRDLMLKALLPRLYAREPFFGSVARTVEISPEETVEVPFLLSWSFPHHRIQQNNDNVADGASSNPVSQGEYLGHRYSEFGEDANKIFEHFLPHRDLVEARSATFTSALYNSTLPEWLCNAINAELTSLTTNTWYIKDGQLAWWDGVGGCGFWELNMGFYPETFLALFFPEAVKHALETITSYQRDDGYMPLIFDGAFNRPLFRRNEDVYARFPLQIYRNWIWMGDTEHVRRLWTRLLKSLDLCRRIDFDGDGIPDLRGANQDFDKWMMFGLSPYMASVWPHTLRVMAQMGRALGEDQHCDEWEEQAVEAIEHTEKTLWNGQWYKLYVDRRTGLESNGLLANNLCGEWYARILGLEGALRPDRIKSNLQALFDHREPDIGLRCGWFPDEEQSAAKVGPMGWQHHVCWLRMEYATAAHMIYEGMTDQGLTLCREAFERFHRIGLHYNHSECGEHYIGSLDVWTVLMALQGFSWNCITKKLAFDPKFEPHDHQSVFVVPSCWGVLSQRLNAKNGQCSLEIEEGKLTLRELELSRPPVSVLLGDKPVGFTMDSQIIRLDRDIQLTHGQGLRVMF